MRTAGDGRIVTSSRDVAAFFGKRHDHVLRDIDALILQAPACLPNFGEGSYTLPSTKMQQHRCFDMTRDGFMLLAMGFTAGHKGRGAGQDRAVSGHACRFAGHGGRNAGHRHWAVVHLAAGATDGREPPPRVRVTCAWIDYT
ncbi:Rha family transcriptional regulator [Xanthobacter autotrophicus]|uniref:Rha family transcriptional regulator n=1 Tax=Xanthobacter autotrophicus TaxID=280 RepID=UPI003735B234